jgi:putative RNA 2'-phosphotransferase
MITEKENIKISKFLSLVLRHQPETIGIELDENGWTDVNILIRQLNQAGVKFDFEVLKHVVDSNAKKRFAFNDSFDRIRASQGHTVAIELGYLPQTPPQILFHGTAAKNVESILQSGLQKRDRHHVHLSAETETAVKVGQRHGKPFVFEVDAAKMCADGHLFFISENGVWLTDSVPPQYLISPPNALLP